MLKSLVNDPLLWEAFIEYIENRIKAHQRGLEQSDNLHDIGKFQGKIEECRKLMLLKNEVNNGRS